MNCVRHQSICARMKAFTSHSHLFPRRQVSSIGLINSFTMITPPGADPQFKADVSDVVATVRQYDPVATLPGLLLPTHDSRVGYFAIRSFWVKSGLRLSPLPDFGVAGDTSTAESKEAERIRRWRRGIDRVYESRDVSLTDTRDFHFDSTLRLLHNTLQNHSLSHNYFEDILKARCRDIDVKQYETTQDLINHASLSCGSLIKLVLECMDVSGDEVSRAADEIGIAHGLTNALRQSIPVLSTTGKLIVPADLCIKYGVKSPRYLLSALGMGDEKGKRAMQCAVEDIVKIARCNLRKARARKAKVLAESGDEAAFAFLPGLVSETFLDRLEAKSFHLTDRKLRIVGVGEHLTCAFKTAKSSIQRTY
mmetsp:Transcript_25656/g.55546  ORF Transcript_25656/g.55546 Transcript_25656/m.55546 type:complete len:365 (+) Transcript_25656:136-1230(+)